MDISALLSPDDGASNAGKTDHSPSMSPSGKVTRICPERPSGEGAPPHDISQAKLLEVRTVNKEVQRPEQKDCPLLDLPTELRLRIFSYVLQDVECRRPIIILYRTNEAFIARNSEAHKADRPRNRAVLRKTAILVACQQAYHDSVPILYENAKVEISFEMADSGYADPIYLGPLDKCLFPQHLRHIRLQLSFDAGTKVAMNLFNRRVAALIGKLNDKAELRTVELVFINESGCGHHVRHAGREGCDQLLAQFSGLKCKRLVSVAHNQLFGSCYLKTSWEKLASRLEGWKNGDSGLWIRHKTSGEIYVCGKVEPGDLHEDEKKCTMMRQLMVKFGMCGDESFGGDESLEEGEEVLDHISDVISHGQ